MFVGICVMRRYLQFALALSALLMALSAKAATYSVSEIPNVQIADRTKHFSNPDGIAGPAAAARIDSLLLDARRAASVEIAVVAVDDIDSDDIDGYATDLFRAWGIGKSDKNNGILMLVAKDKRKAVIRTGYGAEGIMPDILAGRIINDVMAPRFREGDYDGGLLRGVEEMHRLVTDPEAAAELKSDMADNYGSRRGNGPDFFTLYLAIGGVVCVALLVLIAIAAGSARGKDDYQKYMAVARYRTPFLLATVFFIGIPLPALALLLILCKHWRDHGRKCPRCNAKMHKLDEDTDNKYLTMAQDLEERLDSVDYDVWLCPECGETDIYSFVNERSQYKQCPTCHAHTLKLVGARVLQEPTTQREGIGEKMYVCLNCRNRHNDRYSIPKKAPDVPIIVAPIGGRGGFGGGGGYGGGFGGGSTGGGGASGGW